MTDEDREIEEMTPGDWDETGRWDAGHTADASMLLPYRPLDIAVWSHFHSVPVAWLVDHLIRIADEEDRDQGAAIAWAEHRGGDVSEEDFLRWRAGFNAQASAMVCAIVDDALSEAEHMTHGELRREVLRIARLRPRLPAPLCVHETAATGGRTCVTCGADVPRSTPTVDDIPVLR